MPIKLFIKMLFAAMLLTACAAPQQTKNPISVTTPNDAQQQLQ